MTSFTHPLKIFALTSVLSAPTALADKVATAAPYTLTDRNIAALNSNFQTTCERPKDLLEASTCLNRYTNIQVELSGMQARYDYSRLGDDMKTIEQVAHTITPNSFQKSCEQITSHNISVACKSALTKFIDNNQVIIKAYNGMQFPSPQLGVAIEQSVKYFKDAMKRLR